jgi:hypothetical protein
MGLSGAFMRFMASSSTPLICRITRWSDSFVRSIGNTRFAVAARMTSLKGIPRSSRSSWSSHGIKVSTGDLFRGASAGRTAD